ncbi:MAG TPA: DUF2066 domain-containing protein [bacterium]|nr:DUF2066 domain-containing protein [bacterium]
MRTAARQPARFVRTLRPARPWTRLLIDIPLALLLIAPLAASAQRSGELYQATVIVTGTDMRSRPLGFAQALRTVFVTVSGEPRLRDDPRVAAFAAHADSFVTSFSYVDRMAGRPVHDEQGTRDRPYNLTVRFDPDRIDKALATLGEHPWREPRPVVVPVLTVRAPRASYLLSAENPAGAEQRAAFADVARDFGMRVRFPSNADFSRWGVIAGRFPAPPAATSPGEAVVAGTLEFQEALPGWVGTWRLEWRGAQYTWGIRGVNFDQAFRDLTRGVVRVASGHGAP